MGHITKSVIPQAQTRKAEVSEISLPAIRTGAARRPKVFEEDVFQLMLTQERRRAERSRKPFVLMLLDAHRENGLAVEVLQQALIVVGQSTRQTDMIGWYQQGAVVGIIFTELGSEETGLILETLSTKFSSRLREGLRRDWAAKIAITLHVFPETWDRNLAGWVADSKLYPDLKPQVSGKRLSLAVKRAIDLLGSAGLLAVMAPLLAAIAVVIKLTSRGPVLFEQERMGKRGARFKCLKFRTMYLNCDSKIHEEYVQQFIAGKPEIAEQHSEPANPTVYKITNDPRVTPIGRLLRKFSFDELPQLWNVVRGEMSLVGPRPPVPYEFEIYDVWHRRRVLEVKPGITGLWQVSGRSRTRFDDMVRLDLRYCQSWSLWLDIKILMATPAAAFWGDGAY
jgi:lipopolysaccharide/colanic/teichoic acid biosynthesis glycosyltransferase